MEDLIVLIIFWGLGSMLASAAAFIICAMIQWIGMSIITSKDLDNVDKPIEALRSFTMVLGGAITFIGGLVLTIIFYC